MVLSLESPMHMERGEVHWYEIKPPDKRRPVLIMTRHLLNEVTVAPMTTTIRRIPSEIILGIEDGLPQECAVNFDHLQTVPKAKIGRLITSLSANKMEQAASAVCFALGIDDLIL
jgi:mRNA interferase MazF